MRGDITAAEPLIEESLANSRGNWIMTTLCQEGLADLARQKGDELRAQALLGGAVEMCERVNANQKQTFYLGLLAESLWATGDLGRAVDCLERAVEVGDGVTLSHALLMSRMGNFTDAIQWLQRFRESEPDPDRRVMATLALARLWWWQGDLERAKKLCEQAITVLEPTKLQRYLLPAEVLMSCLGGAAGDAVNKPGRAGAHCGAHVLGEMALDVATLLSHRCGEWEPNIAQRFIALTVDVPDRGLAFRIAWVRANLLEQVGDLERAMAVRERARQALCELREVLPEMHRQMFDEHPWVLEVSRYRVV